MTERELERRARRRLAVLRHVEEVSGNVVASCRYCGISRQCYYGWLQPQARLRWPSTIVVGGGSLISLRCAA